MYRRFSNIVVVMVFTIRDANNIIPTTISATNKLVYVLHGGCDDGTSEIEAIDVSRRKYNYVGVTRCCSTHVQYKFLH